MKPTTGYEFGPAVDVAWDCSSAATNQLLLLSGRLYRFNGGR